MARLILSLRGRELDKFLLSQGKVIIGRSPDCDIAIDNTAISRQHASIEHKDGEYFLSDLKSSNGTFLNGDKVQEMALLAPGDSVGIAKFTLSFQETPQAEVQKLMEGVDDFEATVVVDSERMAKAMVDMGEASAVSGPRKLVVLKGSSNTKELPIERDVITVGKDGGCDLVIPGFRVAKVEATLTRKQNKYLLKPLGKTVKVNNIKITSETELVLGDTFAVGKTYVAFT
jgi:pSer/pThr/pTyr-binding forkhead associated (FHA) protein